MVGSVGKDGLGTYLINALKDADLLEACLSILPNHQNFGILVGNSVDKLDFITYSIANIQIDSADSKLKKMVSLINTLAFTLCKKKLREIIF